MKRKNLRILVLILLSGTFKFSFAQAHHATKVQTTQPNIIVFLVDDMGWEDTSVPFYKESTPLNKKYHTPNMERLAAMGVKFTQAYATCVCTPSRVSLQTGMNAARHRVTNWTDYFENHPTDSKYPNLILPAWNYNGLSPVPDTPHTVYATTLAEILKEHGYFTIHAGKAHFASYPTLGSDPKNLGFDINIAGNAVGGPKSYLGTENFGNEVKGGYTPRAIPGLELYHGKDIFLSEALTLEAKKALDDARYLQRPFFLYMAQYAVHAQYKPDNRFYPQYIKEGLGHEEAEYAALLQGMDKSLGNLLDYLDKYHLTQNTIIIFMSDNGGLTLVPPRGGKPFTHNLPLKAGKGSGYEGGIREPMIVYWPGVTKPNTINHQYVMIEDFFPTILQMAGINNYRTVQKVDGKSFVPFLKNPTLRDNTRALFWHFPNYWQEGQQRANEYKIQGESEGMGPYSSIRKGEWKLIYFYGTNSTELYNLKTDIGEHHNLAAQYPSKALELIKLLNQKLEAENAQFPINGTTGAVLHPSLSQSK
ncbi:sulfatase [Ginsengibacter hankyongi]|uniref:Sulfatase n=1 Tax=Ginsengibacter hankyongi TaxID=2607284 RepID=A0A5J5IMD3_9BACT|nr:sulfatase [Ginsengibacter hankyongi]KAA9041911.1 sulfatase [Ginsengibacter hankyongi]